jgi:hypothetical protein
VYLGGVVVWALATLMHPDSKARFVAITAADIEALRSQLIQDPLCIIDPVMAQRKDPQCMTVDIDFSTLSDPERRVQASAHHREIVTSIYSLDQLKIAMDILSALSRQLDISSRRMFFARSSLRAWTLGFVLEREAGGTGQPTDVA